MNIYKNALKESSLMEKERKMQEERDFKVALFYCKAESLLQTSCSPFLDMNLAILEENIAFSLEALNYFNNCEKVIFALSLMTVDARGNSFQV